MVFKKRGQITIFLAIAILIIFMFVYIFYVKNLETKKILVPSSLDDSVENYVHLCIEESIGYSSFYIGKTGGFNYQVDNFYVVNISHALNSNVLAFIDNHFYEMYNVTYLYNLKTNKRFLPTIEQLHENYKKKINETLFDCFDDFTYFKNQNYEINLSYLDIHVDIKKKYSLVDIDMLLTYERGDVIRTINDIPTTHVPLKIGKAHAISEYIINSYTLLPALGGIIINSGYVNYVYNNYDMEWRVVKDIDNGVHYYFIKQNNKGKYELVHNFDEHFLFLLAVKLEDD
ncbi:MAG: hypothetical protein ACOC3X_00380 [Nanoarchaeota archaeon]